jgi:hypothetical protein
MSRTLAIDSGKQQAQKRARDQEIENLQERIKQHA